MHERAVTPVFRFMPANVRTLSYHTHATPNVNFFFLISVLLVVVFPFLHLSWLCLCDVLHQIPRKNLFIVKGTGCLELHRLEEAQAGGGLAPACFPAAPCFYDLDSTTDSLLKDLKEGRK